MTGRRSYLTRQAVQGSRAKAIGKDGEERIRGELHLRFHRVHRIHTPFRIIRDSRGKIVDAIPEEKVPGDFQAVTSDGKAVLVEVKSTMGDRIIWSDLADHQIEELDAHVALNAPGFLGVVIQMRPLLLPWPIEGFGPGGSIILRDGSFVLRKGVAKRLRPK